MQVTGDPECTSELSSSAAREQNVHRAGPSGILTHPPENNDAAVDWLCQRRLDALKAVDESGFTFRFKLYLVACTGFLTDAYDIFALNLALVIGGGNRMYGIELIVIVIATFAISLAGSDLEVYIIGVHVIWRFIVGSEHPLSAVIASEFAPTSVFDRLMPRVFTPEGWGNLADSLVALVWGKRGGAREGGAHEFGNGRQGRAERRRRQRASRRRGGLK